ncbi:2-nitropropane dioxygenase [Methyloceanibacter marginalis]|uniref:Propionate 3-nitronate monooxygenase n=1 Tax=Methyloceanibacter marginalis TaxID=1774971 RepID=A0A1E3WEQ9_9HYPH|nr:nitronate monooxygenase [Methyloceanibacter marginalis]ODS04002.1 2-nitropropane dioxygenase [Methyloceanibacter marginalis]
MTWPDTRILDLFGIDLPIVQAPMANSTGVEVAIEVAKAGGLGALPCAVLSPKEIEAGVATFRTHTTAPINCNFFCHQETPDDQERDRAWLLHLAPYFAELHEDPPSLPLPRGHAPFGEDECAVLEALRPEVVSFHFGLPAAPLLARVKAAGCKIISTATSLREAVFLGENGVDAIIAQGAEAGGHRGMFLETEVATQVGTFALVRNIRARLDLPVVAAGGIADGRAVAGAFALGARAVQVGTAYLLCPEAWTHPAHRAALADPDRETAITNVLTGRRPAASSIACASKASSIPASRPFPRGRPAIAPLRAKAEALGKMDFSPLWSGQAAKLPEPMGAAALTKWLAEDARANLPQA